MLFVPTNLPQIFFFSFLMALPLIHIHQSLGCSYDDILQSLLLESSETSLGSFAGHKHRGKSDIKTKTLGRRETETKWFTTEEKLMIQL